MKTQMTQKINKKEQIADKIRRFQEYFQRLSAHITSEERRLGQIREAAGNTAEVGPGPELVLGKMCSLQKEVYACLQALFASDSEFSEGFRQLLKKRLEEESTEARLKHLEDMEIEGKIFDRLEVVGGQVFQKIFGFSNPLRPTLKSRVSSKKRVLAAFIDRQQRSEKKRGVARSEGEEILSWKSSLRVERPHFVLKTFSQEKSQGSVREKMGHTVQAGRSKWLNSTFHPASLGKTIGSSRDTPVDRSLQAQTQGSFADQNQTANIFFKRREPEGPPKSGLRKPSMRDPSLETLKPPRYIEFPVRVLLADFVANEAVVNLFISLHENSQKMAFESFLEKHGHLQEFFTISCHHFGFLKGLKEQKLAYLDTLLESKALMKQHAMDSQAASDDRGELTWSARELELAPPVSDLQKAIRAVAGKNKVLVELYLGVQNILSSKRMTRHVQIASNMITEGLLGDGYMLLRQNLFHLQDQFDELRLEGVIRGLSHSSRRRGSLVGDQDLMRLFPLLLFFQQPLGELRAFKHHSSPELAAVSTEFIGQKCQSGLRLFRERLQLMEKLSICLSEIWLGGDEGRRVAVQDGLRRILRGMVPTRRSRPGASTLARQTLARITKTQGNSENTDPKPVQDTSAKLAAPSFVKKTDSVRTVVIDFFRKKKVLKNPTRLAQARGQSPPTQPPVAPLTENIGDTFRLLQYLKKDQRLYLNSRPASLDVSFLRRSSLNQTTQGRFMGGK